MGRLKSMVRRVSSPSDRRVARQTFWMGSIGLTRILLGLAQVAITARLLGVEGYGALAVVISVTSLIYGVLAAPGGETVVTFVTREVAEGKREQAGAVLRFAFAISLGLSLIAYAAIVVLTLTVGRLLGIDEAHATAIYVYGLTGIFLATQSEALAVLRLSERAHLGLIVTLVASLTSLGLIAMAWQTGGGLAEVVRAYVVAAAVNGIGMFAAAATAARRAGIVGLLSSLSIKVPSDVLRFHAGTFGKATIGHLANNLDVILVAQLSSIADAGLYRAGRRIVDTARFPFRPLINGVHVEFSKQWYSHDGAELRRTAFRFTLIAVVLSASIFGTLVIFRQPLSQFILGDGFLGVGSLVLIMSLGSFVAGSASTVAILPEATGRVKPSLVARVAALSIWLVILLWLVPQYGAEGAAWANTASLTVAAIVIVPFVASILRRSHSEIPDLVG